MKIDWTVYVSGIRNRTGGGVPRLFAHKEGGRLYAHSEPLDYVVRYVNIDGSEIAFVFGKKLLKHATLFK